MDSSQRFSIKRLIDRAGHVGLWAGMYVLGAYVCFWQLADAGPVGSWPAMSAVVGVLLCATAVYAFDRVKISDCLLDPADLEAHPERYQFLERYSIPVRAMATVMIVVAMTLAYAASHWMPILVAGAVLGVVIYAPGPRGKLPRPKDIMILKNLLVAVAVVMLSMLATALVGPLSHVHGDAFWQLAPVRLHAIIPAVLTLLVRVVADAALCDVDDAESDQNNGTRTFSTTYGKPRAIVMAISLRLLFSVLILFYIHAPLTVRIVWATVNAAATLSLLLRMQNRFKDVIDLSLLIESILCSVLVVLV